MSVTIPTKDVGEVRDKITPQHEEVQGIEDAQQEYIKRSMRIKDGEE